tara:strand:+ start:1737 stop:2924 length:1188 start_codon:yes stop_codon:yes gene_type:complete
MSAAPKTERLIGIDALRGVAVLGILMMNVQAFAMVPGAYDYPLAHMDMSGLNAQVWAIGHTFFSMKFITIFSALFGAGIMLMVGENPDTGLHYRRMLWLLAFGMVHAYLLWYGDILVPYALLGMLAVKARFWSTGKLIIWGLILIALTGVLVIGLFHAVMAMKGFDPLILGVSEEISAASVTSHQAGYLAQLPDNAMTAAGAQFASLIIFGGRIIGVMLVGMALFKNGFLSASLKFPTYFAIGVPSLLFGLALSAWSSEHALATNFALETAWQTTGSNYVGSLFVALGYAAAIMVICKSGWLGWLVHVFAATGRMAFTNYLTQTLIMTFIFVGAPGLGLFGTVERIDQAKLVLLVWALQLIWSPLWLHRFRFGPFEWAWRSLTYGRLQPLLRQRE